MLVKDEALQARHALQTERSSYADRVNQATLGELGRARVMDGLAPNQPARQLGRVMTPYEFETRVLARLGVPNLMSEVHPTNAGKRCLYQVRGAHRELICVYENNPMPEFSIIMGVEQWVPDLDYVGEGGKVARRADLGVTAAPVTNETANALLEKHGWQGALDELQKRASDAEPSRIGMRRIVTPGREQVRGWRTVLVYLMQHGLVSPEQIRNVVGDADRASWVGYMNDDKSALAQWLN